MDVLSITKNNRFKFLYILTLNILIYVNYKTFLLAFMFFIFVLIKESLVLNNFESILFKLIPINYYFNAIYSTFKNDPYSSFFWDMQNFLHYLRCNTGPYINEYKFINERISCPDSIGYGPLVEYIQFTFEGIWEVTVLIGILFLFVLTIFLIFSKKNLYLTVSILISPGFHFLIFSLNTDLIVFLYIFFLIKTKELEYRNSNFIILTIITLIKTYTVMLFFGYLIKFIMDKKSKYAALTLSYFLFNIIILIYHYYFQNSLLPSPLSFTRSFGLLHDFRLVFDNIGFDEVSYLAIGLLIIFNLFKNKLDLNKLEIKLNETIIVDKVIVFFPLCFLINVYANWGYKFVFNSLFIYIIYAYSNKLLKILFIFTNLLATTYYSIGWGFTENLYNYFMISTSKVFFYFYFLFSIYVFVIAVLSKVDKK